MDIRLTQFHQVAAAFADSRLVPPPVPATGATGSAAWLRATVSRFSSGPDHRRRRALAESPLATLDPAALRVAARTQSRRYDVPADAARRVPVAVLADALGMDPTPAVDAVATVSPAYFGSAAADADAAAQTLFDLVGPGEPEERAARIGLLVQAYDATAGLIGNALTAVSQMAAPDRWPVVSVLTETLRHAPPVPVARRYATTEVRIGPVIVATGDLLVLDLAAANRDPAVFPDPDRFDPNRPGAGHGNRHGHLTFGRPPRECPGQPHALAIAAGVVEAGWTR